MSLPVVSSQGSEPAIPAGRPFEPLPFFRIWLALGAQSFGGGPVTLTLIRRAAVQSHHWITDDEFTRYWALVQMAPGVNLLALVVLIGRQAGGWRGVIAALLGLLLPCGLLAIWITAIYAHFADVPLVHAAVRGIMPATIGMGMQTTWRLLVPVVRESWRNGRLSAATPTSGARTAQFARSWAPLFCDLFLVGSAALLYALQPSTSVAAVLVAAGLLSAATRWLLHASSSPTSPEQSEVDPA